MGLKEVGERLGRRIIDGGKTIHRPERPVFGRSGAEFSKAVGENKVVRGDELSVVVDNDSGKAIEVNLIYDGAVLGKNDEPTSFVFLLSMPERQVIIPFSPDGIYSWRKIGHVGPEEFQRRRIKSQPWKS